MGVFYQGANRKYEGEFGAIAMCSETGTGWQNLCEDAQTLTETWRNRVSLAHLGEDAETLAETRFLSLRRYGIRNRARSRPRLLIFKDM